MSNNTAPKVLVLEDKSTTPPTPLEITLTETAFSGKSPNKGVKFPFVEFNRNTFDSLTKAVGLDWVFSVLNKNTRQIFGGLILTHTNKETGVVNWDAWSAEAAEFNVGEQKLSDINEEIEELSALQSANALDENFGATADDGTLTPAAIALNESMVALSNKLKPLRALKASIKAEYADRAALRDKKRQEKEAASATQTQAVA